MLRHFMKSWHLNIWEVKIWLSHERKKLSKWNKKTLFLVAQVPLLDMQNKLAKIYWTQPLKLKTYFQILKSTLKNFLEIIFLEIVFSNSREHTLNSQFLSFLILSLKILWGRPSRCLNKILMHLIWFDSCNSYLNLFVKILYLHAWL